MISRNNIEYFVSRWRRWDLEVDIKISLITNILCRINLCVTTLYSTINARDELKKKEKKETKRKTKRWSYHILFGQQLRSKKTNITLECVSQTEKLPLKNYREVFSTSKKPDKTIEQFFPKEILYSLLCILNVKTLFRELNHTILKNFFTFSFFFLCRVNSHKIPEK